MSDTLTTSVDSSDSPLQSALYATSPGSLVQPSSRPGSYKPRWTPDEETETCMQCGVRFSLLKRRHHCRACGKVLCNLCCCCRTSLAYLDYRPARVCTVCDRLIRSAPETAAAITSPSSSNHHHPSLSASSSTPHPGPSSSSPSSSTTSSTGSAPPETPSSPVSVLRRPSDVRSRNRPVKNVIFSDGIRPGGDLTEPVSINTMSVSPLLNIGPLGAPTTSPSSNVTSPSQPLPPRSRCPPIEPVPPSPPSSPGQLMSLPEVGRIKITDSLGPLPPIMDCPELDTNPTLAQLLLLLQSGCRPFVTFYLIKNLHVMLSLCSNVDGRGLSLWCFSSKGLLTVGQDEVAVLLEKTPGESCIPRDIFRLCTCLYDAAVKGTILTDNSHLLMPHESGLLGNKDNSGFFFCRMLPQFHLSPSHGHRNGDGLSGFHPPETPFLVALLMQRSEVPWAKVFPPRLLLGLGLDMTFYPYPVISYRNRKAVFYELGQTIINVLADFRNYQYTISIVPGVRIERTGGRTVLSLPRNRYDLILKLLNQTNEHVLAIGCNFNPLLPAHYACSQNDEGQYQTEIFRPSFSFSPSYSSPSGSTSNTISSTNDQLQQKSQQSSQQSSQHNDLKSVNDRLKTQMIHEEEKELQEIRDIQAAALASDKTSPHTTMHHDVHNEGDSDDDPPPYSLKPEQQVQPENEVVLTQLVDTIHLEEDRENMNEKQVPNEKSITNHSHDVTSCDVETIGGSFIAFGGSLKTTSGLTGKSSLVEDGILVQILPHTMAELKTALRDMKDLVIPCGRIQTSLDAEKDKEMDKEGKEVTTQPEDCVVIQWTQDDSHFNIGVTSPIDGRSLKGVPSARIHNGLDFANSRYLIRWTEVFFIENEPESGRRVEPTKAAGIISRSLCQALTPYLDQLVEKDLIKIGLRVTLHPEQMGFEVGSNEKSLPPNVINSLDDALIPIIERNVVSNLESLLVLEMFFYILVK